MTRRFAVFGNPVNHSLSPLIHTIFSAQTGVALLYEKIQPGDFEKDTMAFFQEGGRGLNITLPFKQRAWKLVQAQAGCYLGHAKLSMAVNTLFYKNATLIGANTDGIGLVRDIVKILRWDLKKRRILLLGAGGAAYGVTASLLEQDIEKLCVVNRTPSKAEQLVAHFKHPKLTLGDMQHQGRKDYDLLINATSFSLNEKNSSEFAGLFHPELDVYDMAYDLEKPTSFLRCAQSVGVRKTSDGLGMLVEQAAASFMLWNKDATRHTPNTQELLSLLRNRNPKDIFKEYMSEHTP